MTVHKLTWEDCGAKIDEQVIELIEAKLKHRFPQDFRAVILECHGGHPKPACFSYYDPDIGSVETSVAELLSFDLKCRNNIVRTCRALSDWLPSGVIPFVSEGGGDFVCFDYRGHEEGMAPVVVYWSHEREPETSIIFLCSTFSEFLKMLR